MKGLRNTALCFILLGIVLCAGCSGNDSDQPRKPNILLILADDLGNNDIASWGDGTAPTPTLDKLSRQSIRFRHHYTDSTCSVSRAALLTGRAPVSIGFEPDGMGLSPDMETLPKSLKSLGYRTHHVGKWHVGEAIESRDIWPDRQGFDDWFGMLNHFVLQGPDAQGKLIRRGPTYYNPWLQESNAPPRQHNGHLDDLLTQRAVDLIKQANKSKPWFINLWLLAPHHPIEPADSFKRRFPDTPEGRYMALLSQLDHNVARVLLALEASGQTGNTVVVFGSDNGSPNISRNSNYPFKGLKASYLEGGVRAPLMIRWPGHRYNTDIEAITQITDIYPTLIRMAQGKIPEGIDGTDLTGVMDNHNQLPDRPQYWAADVKGWGMTYAGHLPEKGMFYRDLSNHLQTPAISGPFLNTPQSAPVQYSFSREEASRLIQKWEIKHRPIQLKWDPRLSTLRGRDYQRAPIFGSYTLGLELHPDTVVPGKEKQTIIEQQGVWGIYLDGNMRLSVLHDNKRLEGPVIHWRAGCNSLVSTFAIKPESTFPFPGKAQGLMAVYLNGKKIMESEELMSRPESLSRLEQPTYLGKSADGSSPFMGLVTRPIVVGKFLLPMQDGYSLQDMQQNLCH